MARAEVEIAVEAVQAGTSAVGSVVEARDDAGLLGRRVLLAAHEPCGECEVCRRGGAGACPAARIHELAPGTKTIRVATRWLVELGDGLDLPDWDAAAVAGDVVLAYTLYARANLGPGEPVIVVGATAVARFLVEILAGKGIAPVVAVGADAPASWRGWLAARGITAADASAESIAAALAGPGATAAAGPPRPWRIVVADCHALADALALAGPRAQITAWARPGVAQTATAAAITGALAREVALAGVATGHPDLVVETAAMVVRGDIDLAAGVVRADRGEPPDPTRTTIHLTRRADG